MNGDFNPAREVKDRIDARYPLLAVVSHEERHVLDTLIPVAFQAGMQPIIWSVSRGFVKLSRTPEGKVTRSKPEPQPDPIEVLKTIYGPDDGRGARTRSCYLLLDFQPYLGDPTVQRWLRDLADVFRRALQGEERVVVLLGPTIKPPPELERDVAVIDWPLPTRARHGRLLDALARIVPEASRAAIYRQPREQMIEAALGLTSDEAEDIFSLSLVRTGGYDVSVVATAKEEAVRKSGLLEFHRPKLALDDIGGYDALKGWLLQRRRAFTKEAKDFGIEPPRGLLALGPPGCGKSYIAKIVPAVLGMPEVRLDVGKLFGGIVGQSEAQTRDALKVVEAIAPCVLWLEEIDKAFAGTQSAGDSGTAARVFGTFLTWMQERDQMERPVFLFATGNDVSMLPPELLRRGRFSEIFFIDLPTTAEREQILAVHLRLRRRDPAKFDLKHVARETQKFTGAELESAITEGLQLAFDAHREVTTEDLLAASKTVVPLETTMREKINALREWARTRARAASTPEPEGDGSELRYVDLSGGRA